MQAYVEADPDVDIVSWVLEADPRLRRMAVLDAALNNTDRKGGHILPVDGGRHLYGVDHGVCFSPVPKLRTVLWAWRGTPFDPDEIAGLERIREGLDGDLGASLRELLSASGGAGDATAARRPARRGTVPAPLPDLAGDPLAAVLTVVPRGASAAGRSAAAVADETPAAR